MSSVTIVSLKPVITVKQFSTWCSPVHPHSSS